MPKCKNCKTKFEQKYFLQKYCLQNDSCIKAFSEFAKIESQKKLKKEVKEKKAKLKNEILTLSDYLKIAQQVFNQYINLRDKGKPCVSCDCVVINPNASHMFSVGSSPSLRFNENNVHTSCIRCNMHLHGNIAEYAIRLPNRIGIEAFEELKSKRNEIVKYSIHDVKQIIKNYKEKIKILQKGIYI